MARSGPLFPVEWNIPWGKNRSISDPVSSSNSRHHGCFLEDGEKAAWLTIEGIHNAGNCSKTQRLLCITDKKGIEERKILKTYPHNAVLISQ